MPQSAFMGIDRRAPIFQSVLNGTGVKYMFENLNFPLIRLDTRTNLQFQQKLYTHNVFPKVENPPPNPLFKRQSMGCLFVDGIPSLKRGPHLVFQQGLLVEWPEE